MRSARPFLLLAVTAGCYGMRPIGGAGGGAGGQTGGTAGVQGGRGGETGTAGLSGAGAGGTAGAQGGIGGAIGTGASSGASGSGTGGPGGSGAGGATGGSTPIFVGGPCIATPDHIVFEVFGRVSDGGVYRRPYDGTDWGTWSKLSALDATLIDARSDLDCSASTTSIHIVATGANPVGAFLHAFGFGTAYNPFFRELTSETFGPGASIADVDDSRYTLAALGSGSTFPAIYEIGDSATPKELTPISTQIDSFRSTPDVAKQSSGASGLTFFAAFDYSGALAIYPHVISSGGAAWTDPVKLQSPAGAFAFSPAICVETGSFGIYSVNVAAVAGGQLWYARTSTITSPFSSWTPIAPAPASSPECTVVGSDSIVHVVVLSDAGSVIDVNGKGTGWVATDLGAPR